MYLLLAFEAHPLVHLNAALNGLATVLLVTGYVLIKRGAQKQHGWVMLAAFAASCLFLVSYLTYHYLAGSVKFTHPGLVKAVYLSILFSHVILAALVPFLALASIIYAILGNAFGSPGEQRADYMTRHRRISRWTLPIWLYVSITGVVVYAMLYHIWPPTGE